MSASLPPDDEFQQLRKLLACKKHEQPPPGYFNYFSDRVVAQIEIEERTRVPWWQAAIRQFDPRTAIACAYGFVVTGLLFTGFRVAQVFQTTGALASQHREPWLPLSPELMNDDAASTVVHPGFAATPATFLEPPLPAGQTVPPDPNLFRFYGAPQVQAASFSW